MGACTELQHATMSGRSRRVVQSSTKAGVAAALAKLNAVQAGGKRVETFELKEEAAVYDVVDEEEYATLVTKRRIEAGRLQNRPVQRSNRTPGRFQG